MKWLHTCLFALFGLLFLPIATHAQSCTGGSMQWGCAAYLIGSLPSDVADLKNKGVQTVVIDSQSAAGHLGIVQALRSASIQPVCYTNAFCESRFGGCSGPTMKASDVSSRFSESIPAPNTQFFFSNFARQLNWAKSVGCTVVEIDNMDEYIRRGEVQAIKNLVDIAGTAGFNVVSKNSTNSSVLSISNVVGAVVEPGSGSASDYRSAFQTAGKSCAGVLMINAGGSDSYTSVTQADKSNTREYTQFLGCSATGVAQIPTPPAGSAGALSQLLTQQTPQGTQPTLASLFQQPATTQQPQGTTQQPSTQIAPFFSPQSATAPQSPATLSNTGGTSSSSPQSPILVSQLLTQNSNITGTQYVPFIGGGYVSLTTSTNPEETATQTETMKHGEASTFSNETQPLSTEERSFVALMLEKIKSILLLLLQMFM